MINRNNNDTTNKKIRVGDIVWLILAVISLSILVNAVLGAVNNKISYFFGYASVRIISESMETTIPVGTYILLHEPDEQSLSELKEGDVITFYSRDKAIYGRLNTHRILTTEIIDGETAFITKGDNNMKADSEYVLLSDIAGIYVKNMNGLTSVVDFMVNQYLYILMILFPLLIVMGLSAGKIFSVLKEKRMERLVSEEVERLKQEAVQKADELKIAEAEENDTK